MKITRIPDTRDTPIPDADRDWWSVDVEDGGQPGLVRTAMTEPHLGDFFLGLIAWDFLRGGLPWRLGRHVDLGPHRKEYHAPARLLRKFAATLFQSEPNPLNRAFAGHFSQRAIHLQHSGF